MGYTHYWYRPKEVDRDTMNKIIRDFIMVKAETDKHVRIKGGNGCGEPIIKEDLISFNGDKDCGHQERRLGITWPSDSAGGINDKESTVDGRWFAGATLAMRSCGGDCSHETCYFPRIANKESMGYIQEDGNLVFSFCKTAYKPYDLIVIAFLIILKRHLKGDIKVSSDGNDGQWFDGKQLCHTVLGYGLDFVIDEQKGELIEGGLNVH